jgi:GDP-4-dehydro-6-deoxy-D-mannose reductase
MRALVTGAGGFIGGRVAAALREAGVEVFEIGRESGADPHRIGLGPAPWPARRLAGVLEETRPDAIFHLAGARAGTDDAVREINLGLCESLLGALRETGQRPTLVVSGSAAEYGDGLVDGEAIDETRECKPTSAYGATKLAQTESVAAFSQETGARGVVARIFTAIGPGMPAHLAVGSFAHQINAFTGKSGELVTGDIDVKRDFLSGDSVANAFVGLALHPEANGVINICSGEPIAVRRLVEAMVARSGKDIRIRIDPARLRPGEPRVIYGDNRRLSSLGIKTSAANIEEVAGSLVEAGRA